MNRLRANLGRLRWRLAGLVALAGLGIAGIGAIGPAEPLGARPARAGTAVLVRHFTVRSALAGGTRRETLVVPDQWRRGGPLLLFLHARGSTEESALTPALFTALRGLGRRAPAMVIPSDDRWSFWHDRRGAAWGSYVVDEVLPRALAIAGADPARVAVGGISMGGFGALNLDRLHPGRFCAVGAHSPAIYTAAQPKLRGAFDNRADFARNDLLALAARRPRAFAGPRLWLDVGRSDPFAAADLRFVAELRRAGVAISAHEWPGRHSGSYWRSHWGSYLGFYAGALASCRRG